MSAVTLTPAQRELLRQKLETYCDEQFDLQLEQFDAEFFADFIIDQLGPLFFNAGIDEAIRTHLAYSDRIQEEMDLKKIY
ncbi:DUF2164 family protein [Pluralibacter gergoviae]|uniref:DUF2164 family protein n=1 Tax=Pluralibacter gergoviae TaxID=61647 RepID=A0AAI9GPS4_PLUGE|nr:DUF2164 family protein [Pluralibacter gergoviae]AIR03028.1 hypothetical protein LG71_25395 [Pluralibacter gergoviae]AVR02691.1 DUF2164 domain-containing protein [Pluralibacter gergoviae]EKT9639089.1 DUF2164 family protein [Pluralibacter gergoviae]EKV0918185.1 DUF2164 family protein [Pluralibacter gergoviae]EKV0931823.1 DUF2164 family protein [Pluralibacter gergoviae]